MSSSEFIVVGNFGSPYGIKGWIKINSYTAPATAIMDYHPWYVLAADGNWQEINIDSMSKHGKGIIAHIAGFDDRDLVRIYTNRELAIRRKQLPTLEKEEYYWTDLIGLTVINQANITLGVVDHLLETGANDVLVIIGPHSCMIPFVMKIFIKEVDLKEKTIRVDWDAE